ncbi:hypothetical protein LCGC14_2083330 [marine sediment metagenome]|uniref:Helix-turn-helix domain-containing protein n=1 Tax=marine sediment metagenome TaxID=412755 RepID=A0A0F9EF64_9ZZZZ|nr:helix-turn-helix domain-containing protein [Phycisphaerales bacterium]
MSKRAIYISVGNIARELAVATVTVRRWITAGKLSAVKLAGGRKLRILVTEYERFKAAEIKKY